MQKSEDGFSRAISKFKNTGLCRECKRVKDKADYRKHRDKRLAQYKKYAEANYEKVRKINKLAVNKRRFGIDRNKLITEDSICSNCGMTQEEHLDRYSLSLNIHHIDGNGRHAEPVFPAISMSLYFKDIAVPFVTTFLRPEFIIFI